MNYFCIAFFVAPCFSLAVGSFSFIGGLTPQTRISGKQVFPYNPS